MNTSVLNCRVDLYNMEECLSMVEEAIEKKKNFHIITLNPEMISHAQEDESFLNIINSSELNIEDGVGIRIALKLRKITLHRIRGIDFSRALIKMASEKNLRIGFLGSCEENINKACENILKEYPNLNIVYKRNGYFDNRDEITEEIKKAKPQILLVGLGSPLQEEMIVKFRSVLEGCAMIGVGGSLDVFSGNTKESPKIFRKYGLEWLYRTMSEPKRIKRIFPALPIFLIKCIIDDVDYSNQEKVSDKVTKNTNNKDLKLFTNNVRQDILKMIHNAKSGHPGGSLSCVDILAVLYNKILSIPKDWDNSHDFINRDRFILSKGHASPALYATLAHMGFFSKDLLMGFRILGSKLQGHPSSRVNLPGIEVSTGSLGQGLSIGVGLALSMRLDNIKSKVYVLLGDGEMQEGNVWEAFMGANSHKLENLVVIIDKNNLQIDGHTYDIKTLEPLDEKLKAFGFEVETIDGHDFDKIEKALTRAKEFKGRYAIIANTIKGKGVSFMEDNVSWHGKAPKDEELKTALEELNAAR